MSRHAERNERRRAALIARVGLESLEVRRLFTASIISVLGTGPRSLLPISGEGFGDVVATFSVPRYNVADPFTATIDWGDGQTSSGLVTRDGADGAKTVGFSVTGDHGYAAAGTLAVHVTIVDPGLDSATAACVSYVADQAPMATAPIVTAMDVAAAAGSGFAGAVATFQGAGSASDYSAVIDWGDGGSSAGVVSAGGSGGFSVGGSHTYVTWGNFPLTTWITGPGGGRDFAVGSALVAPPDRYPGLSNVPSIQVTVNDPAINNGQTATCNLHYVKTPTGYDNPSLGPYIWLSDQSFYSQWGSYFKFSLTFNENYYTLTQLFVDSIFGHGANMPYRTYALSGGGNTASPLSLTFAQPPVGASTSATLAASGGGGGDAPLVPIGGYFVTNPGVAAFPDNVAEFADLDPASYRATIDWGDNSPKTTVDNLANLNSIVNKSGIVSIKALHAYQRAGYFPVTVAVTDLGYPNSGGDPGGNTITIHSTAIVVDQPYPDYGPGQRSDTLGLAGTIALGEASVSPNTGSLRLTQPLDFDQSPGKAVGGAPALVYNSGTVDVRPIIEFTTSVIRDSAKQEVPSSIQAQLDWNGTAQPWVTFATNGHRIDDTYLLALQDASPATITGVYNYSVRIRYNYSDGTQYELDSQPSGLARAVVGDASTGDATNAVGPGWGLAGVPHLVNALGGVLWVDGGGESRYFRQSVVSMPTNVQGDLLRHGIQSFFYYGYYDSSKYLSPEGDLGVLSENAGTFNGFTYTTKNKTEWHFDGRGLLTDVVDPHGVAITYTYDDSNRLTRVLSPDGGVTTLAYSGGLLANVVEPGNRVVTLTRDGSGNLTGIVDAAGNSRIMTYDAGHRVTHDQWGPLSVTFSYDPASGALTGVDRGSGSAYRIAPAAILGLNTSPAATALTTSIPDVDYRLVWDASSAVVIDPSSHATTYVIDDDGRTWGVAQPRGISWGYDYYHSGELAKVSGPLNPAYDEYIYDLNRLGNMLTSATGHDLTHYQYDYTFNEISRSTDPSGNLTQYTYDPNTGDLLTETDPTGAVTTYTWSQGLLQSVTEPANPDGRARTTTYLYDSARRLQVLIDPLGDRTTYTYDAAGNPATVTDPDGDVITTVYDADDRLISETNPPTPGAEAAQTTTYAYDASGDKVGETDPRGYQTRWVYDRRGWLTNVIGAAGQADQTVTTTVYDPAGNVVSEIDARGEETDYGYDANNRRIWTRDPVGNLTTLAYDADGNVTSAVDARGVETDFTYDALDRRTSVTEAVGTAVQRTMTTAYDGDGDVVATIDPLGNETDYRYDPDGRRVAVVEAANSPSPLTATTAYDPDGDVVSTVDARGIETVYAYDADDRPVAVTEGAGSATPLVDRTLYDDAGRVATTVDARGVVTTYAYDEEGRRTGQTIGVGSPTPRSTSTFYDADGDVASTVDARGVVTAYQYDDRDRRVAVTEAYGTPLARTTSTGYDADGDVIAEVDARGVATTYAYDNDGRRVATTLGANTPTPLTSTTAYDADGDVIAEADARGVVTTFSYDAEGRRTGTTEAAGTVIARATATAYDGDGNVTAEVDARGTVTTYSYDAENRRTGMTRGAGTPTPLVTSTAYDADGNVVAATDADGNVTTYAYDAENRRTRTTEAAGTPVARTTAAFYDADGNVTSTVDGRGIATTYAYDAEGERTGVTQAAGTPDQGITTITYDAGGDAVAEVVTRTVRGVATAVEADTTYDALGRATRVVEAAGTPDQRVTSTAYDANDNVIASFDPRGVETDTFYDAFDRVTTVVEAVGTAVQRNTSEVYDADGNVIKSFDGLGHETDTSYDALGRATTVVEAAGTAVQRVTTTAYDAGDDVTDAVDGLGIDTHTAYDPFGRPVAVTAAYGTPLARTTTTAHDADGNVLATTDPLGAVASYAYDALGRQTQAIDPKGAVTTTAFDADGNVVAVTDPDGNATSATFDDRNRRRTSTDPLGHVASYAYDASGDLVATTDRDGRVRTLAYDALGRDVAETWSNADGTVADTLSNTYDAGDDRLTATDHAGTVTFTYDPLGRTATQQGPAGGALASTYDADDDRTAVQDAGGVHTTSTYDALGRLQSRQLGMPGRAPAFAAALGLVGFTMEVFAVAVDPAGDAYITGDFRGTVNFNPGGAAFNVSTPGTSPGSRDIYLAKYSPAGALLWVRDFAGTTTTNNRGNALALDAAGDVVLGGQFTGTVNFNPAGTAPLTAPGSDNDGVVAGYDANGNYLWARQFDDGAYEPVNSVAVDAAGDLFVAGNFSGTANFGQSAGGATVTLSSPGTTNGFALELDVAHRPSWATDLGSGSIDQDKRVAVDPAGDVVYVAGIFTGSGTFGGAMLANAGGIDVYVARLDAAGAVLWARDMGGAGSDTMGGLAVDAAGDAYVGGMFVQTADFGGGHALTSANSSAFVAEVAPDGAVRWAEQFAATTGSAINDLATDAAGDVYAGGNYSGTLNGNPGGSAPLAGDTSGNPNGFVASLTPAGAYRWALALGGPGQDSVTALAVSGTDRVAVAGQYGGTATFGAFTLAANGLYHAYVARIAGTGAAVARVDLAYNTDDEVSALSRSADAAGAAVVGVTTATYDAADRLAGLRDAGPAGAPLDAYAYAYDAEDRLTSETDGGTTTTYAYDAADQLTAAGAAAYGYDPAGDRTTGGSVAGAGNLLAADGTWAYAYDGEGNRVGKTNIATGEAWTYGYDDADRMIWARDASGAGSLLRAATYTYDALGELVEEDVTAGGSTTVQRTQYDGGAVYADLDGTGTVQTRYLRGPSAAATDAVLAEVGASGATAWLLTDRLGSTRAVTDATGAVADRIAYDAYGNVTAETAPAAGGRVKYTGFVQDAATGLNRSATRYYDAGPAVWTTQDPSGFDGGDANLTRYAGNNPTDNVDPSGESWLSRQFDATSDYVTNSRGYAFTKELVVNQGGYALSSAGSALRDTGEGLYALATTEGASEAFLQAYDEQRVQPLAQRLNKEAEFRGYDPTNGWHLAYLGAANLFGGEQFVEAIAGTDLTGQELPGGLFDGGPRTQMLLLGGSQIIGNAALAFGVVAKLGALPSFATPIPGTGSIDRLIGSFNPRVPGLGFLDTEIRLPGLARPTPVPSSPVGEAPSVSQQLLLPGMEDAYPGGGGQATFGFMGRGEAGATVAGLPASSPYAPNQGLLPFMTNGEVQLTLPFVGENLGAALAPGANTPFGWTNARLQGAVDSIHAAEFGAGGGQGVPISVTVSQNGRVVVSQVGRIPGPAARARAFELFGENVKFVRGTTGGNAPGVAGSHAEARAINFLGEEAQGARQATTHFACPECEARQVAAGVQNVTGTQSQQGQITRPINGGQ